MVVDVSGIELRGLFSTARAPWSEVDTVEQPKGPLGGRLAIGFTDGSVRRVSVGAGHAPLALAATITPRSRQRDGAVALPGPNHWLRALLVLGLTLVTVLLVGDATQANVRRHDTGEHVLSADDLRTEQIWLDVSRVAAIVLTALTAIATIGTVTVALRHRERARPGPWTVDEPYVPDADAVLDRASSWVVSRDRVRDAEGRLVLAVSSRRAASRPAEDTVTYWRGARDASFCVHRRTRDGMLRWSLTSWDRPVSAELVGCGPHVQLVVDGTALAVVISAPALPAETAFDVVEPSGRRLATLRRTLDGWACQVDDSASGAAKRLVLVATLWAEQRWAAPAPAPATS